MTKLSSAQKGRAAKMISTGRFQPSPCNSKSLFTTPSLSFSFKAQLGLASSTSSLPTTIFKNNLFLSSVKQSHHTRLRFAVVHVQKSRKFGLQSLRKKRKGGNQLLEMEDSDDEVDGEDEELDLDLDMDGEDEDDEGMMVPFGKMKKWLEKKPRGFGEGKVYDTPIEDQLLDEMQAQVENATKLQIDAAMPNPQPKTNKAADVVPAGFRVRLTNLPKKKNVHRDLSTAFKLVPGLLSINPAVSRNKKTKDPICKGFAFVHFKSEKDATRFVETFSSQSITFGKVQKQIKCELVNSHGPNFDEEQSKTAPRLTTPRLNALKPVTVNYLARGPKPATDPAPRTSTDNYTEPQLTVSALGDLKVDSDLDDSSLDTLEGIVSDEYDGSDVEILGPELEDFVENMKTSTVSDIGGDYSDPQLTVSALGDQKVDSDLDGFSLDTLEETVSDEYDVPDVEILGPELDNFVENLKTSTVSDLNGGESDSIEEIRLESESLADLSPSKQSIAKSKKEKVPRQKQPVKRKVEGSPKKKVTVKEKAAKVPKLVISGSSKRLKVKEKAVLNDVFSKYGLNPTLASKEDS